jgi:hypothetical protein
VGTIVAFASIMGRTMRFFECTQRNIIETNTALSTPKHVRSVVLAQNWRSIPSSD